MTTYVYPQSNVSITTTGVSTEAKQDLQLAEETAINAKIPALGQAAMVASLPVVVASNQTSIPVKLRDSSDVAITLGQTTMSASLPVVLASDQPPLSTTIPVFTIADQIDTTPLLNVSLTNIPASAANSLQIVASLAGDVKKVVSVEDIGEFFGLYSGAVSSPTLLCILPLGGGEINVTIPAGTLVSIRHMKNTTVTSGFIAINFIG